jgi:inner membrane protein
MIRRDSGSSQQSCAMLPDADVLSFGLGVRYESMFGHRGITHSILFALALGILISVCSIRK